MGEKQFPIEKELEERYKNGSEYRYIPYNEALGQNGNYEKKKHNKELKSVNEYDLSFDKKDDQYAIVQKRVKENDVKVLKDFLQFDVKSSTEVFDKFIQIDGAKLFEGNSIGERFLFIQGTRKDRVTLVAHADTFFGGKSEDNHYTNYNEKNPNVPQELKSIISAMNEEIIMNANFYLGIGADDRAGCAILWLLRESGHNILLFDGEESGYIGVIFLFEHEEILREVNNSRFVIEFDYPGKGTFNCHDIPVSSFFKDFIKKNTGFTEQCRIEKTDISILCKDIYGVNFSVGFYNQHTREEYINVDEWWETLDKVNKMLASGIPLFIKEQDKAKIERKALKKNIELLIQSTILTWTGRKINTKYFFSGLENHLSEIASQSNEEKISFMKFALALGCFSNKWIKNRRGENSVPLAQKSCSVLADIFKFKLIIIGQFKNIFSELSCDLKMNFDMTNYLLARGHGKELLNIKNILKLEIEYPGIFSKIIMNFDKVSKIRRTLGEDGKVKTLKWNEAFIKIYEQKIIMPSKDSSGDIICLFHEKGINDDIVLKKTIALYDNARNKNIPHHILGFPLKEQVNSKDLPIKEFTYEMLDKYDPINMILGLYCSCCATITSEDYGKKIAENSIVVENIQNMVVRNIRNEIIGMSTICVNINGFVLLNSFDMDEKYRKHEKIKKNSDNTFSGTPEDEGRYDVPHEHKDEHEREEIFRAFQRGINAFVQEYDKQYPQNPVKQVRVGWKHNRLKRQVEQFERVLGYERWIFADGYDFQDAERVQFILYDRNKVSVNLTSENVPRKEFFPVFG